ncbi:glutathione S-transferase YfcF [Janthinobacterium sp. HH103]|uniref:glutathione transferase n=1 Tax=unclassified Janthinobacterium TaxID=2610881 RepID=UPI000893D08F|nr:MULTISPECIES: glutathione transferase [unclassified Janthinobacterium]OEZ70622.1 glutathione S-transferase YfcF [Janthinobacterium sp. HH103]OEZ91778.1 glutathione S-transferase YfcF [Janthinobacterium sp. HH106]QOU70830.1 Glutathione S-transferase YfcF [Janthinobacterium sp. HH102]
MSLILYVDRNRISPYALSTYVALSEKRLPFTVQDVDLDAGAARQPPFSALSLTQRVPAIDHDGFILTESNAIADYLDDVFAAPDYPSVLPRDLRQRARARQVQAWLRSDLLALRNERDSTVVFHPPRADHAPLSPAAQAAGAKLLQIAGELVQGEHLFGAWSIADTDLALMLLRLIKSGQPVPPALRAYALAQWQRPAVRQWLANVPLPQLA